ncbi:MAG: hypothetical protein AAFW73_04120 [Bacteroidota bacterium]
MSNLNTKTLFLLTVLACLGGCKKEPQQELSKASNLSAGHLPSYEIESPLKDKFFDDQYILSANPHLGNLIESQSQFRDPSTRLSTIQYLIDYQDDQENFIPTLSATLGFPVWSQVESRDFFTFIPLIQAHSDATDAVLIVYPEGDIYDFKLLRRDALYHRLLTEDHPPNFYTELRLFLTFDERLFDYHDPLLAQARAQEITSESHYRCPLLWHWECAEWIVPLWEEGESDMAEERSPCGSVCADCVLIVYDNPNCEQNLPVGGWGRTNGGTFPPEREGGSHYHNGGGGGPNGGGNNPLNWWEEQGYSTLVESLIQHLGLEAEQAHLANCMEGSFQLAALLGNLVEQLEVEQEAVRAAILAGLTTACHCDDYDSRGVEQCDERALFEEKFRSEIVEWLTEGFFFSEEEKEFIKENLPLTDRSKIDIIKLDWEQASEEDRVNHFFKWIAFINKVYRCLRNEENNSNEIYSITNDFFENASASQGYEVYGNINIYLKDEYDNPLTITNTGFVWNHWYNDYRDRFQWQANAEDSGVSNATHFYFMSEGFDPNWGLAYIDLIVPYLHSDVINERLTPCQ